MSAMTIPVLPCVSLADTLAFYRTLGFEVTHEQTKPNVYAATRRGDVHLHFAGLKKLRPEDSYSTCLVIVPEVEALYAELADGLRSAYGKLPVQGFPRISRFRPGASRFTVIDVAGNAVIFIRRDAPDDYDDSVYEPTSRNALGKALHAARRLRDFRNDDAAAAKVLDLALGKADRGDAIDRARVLAARIEIAMAQGDAGCASALRAELEALPLTVAERRRYRGELEAAQPKGSSRSRTAR
jgi:hypothetical protein